MLDLEAGEVIDLEAGKELGHEAVEVLHLEAGVKDQNEESALMMTNLLTNIVNSVLGEEFKCNTCELVLKNKYNLRDHISIVHTPLQSPLKCTKDFCQETFVTKHKWQQHRMGCSFICANCGKVIKRCGRVEGHMRKCNGLG